MIKELEVVKRLVKAALGSMTLKDRDALFEALQEADYAGYQLGTSAQVEADRKVRDVLYVAFASMVQCDKEKLVKMLREVNDD